MIVEYFLADEYVNEIYIKTGNKLSATATLEFDPAELSKKARAGQVALGCATPTVCPTKLYKMKHQLKPLTLEKLIEFLEDAADKFAAEQEKNQANTFEVLRLVDEQLKSIDIKKLKMSRGYVEPRDMFKIPYKLTTHKKLDDILQDHATIEQLQDINNIRKRIDEARDEWREQQAKAREQKEAEKEQAKEVAEKERAEWIVQHGSDQLRLAHKHGYNSQRLYVTERAKREWPQFELDFDDNATWDSRSAPSMEALTLLDSLPDEVRGQIVWITQHHEHDDEYYDPDDEESQEALVIRDYLGKYDLIKYLGDPQG